MILHVLFVTTDNGSSYSPVTDKENNVYSAESLEALEEKKKQVMFEISGTEENFKITQLISLDSVFLVSSELQRARQSVRNMAHDIMFSNKEDKSDEQK